MLVSRRVAVCLCCPSGIWASRGDQGEDWRLGEEGTSMSQVEPGVEIDEEVFEPGDSRFTVIRLSLTAALGGFLFGYDSAVINGAVKAITAHFSASPGVLGFVVASSLLGAAVGALGAADRSTGARL